MEIKNLSLYLIGIYLVSLVSCNVQFYQGQTMIKELREIKQELRK